MQTANQPIRQAIAVTARGEGQRLDNFLFTYLKGVPKSLIYRIIRTGQVRVDKKRVKPSCRLQQGQELRIPPLNLPAADLKPVKTNERQQMVLKQAVLYEDNKLLIINKPAGIAVHGGSGINFGVIETLRQLYRKDAYLELVHRIDKETSGCLILAKKPSVLKEMHALLREGKMHKTYTCLVKGQWDPALDYVDMPLLKQQLSSGERMVKVTATGKSAQTGFKIKQRFTDATLLEATLYTGRTHQIRVHTASNAHPIAGDEKYGDKHFNKLMREQGCKRLFLHASQVKFTLSTSKQPICITAPLDSDLQACLQHLSKL